MAIQQNAGRSEPVVKTKLAEVVTFATSALPAFVADRKQELRHLKTRFDKFDPAAKLEVIAKLRKKVAENSILTTAQ